jgi:hypothetical protein
MRYRFISGQFAGHPSDVLVFELRNTVYRFQMTRLSYVPLPVKRLEEVTPAIAEMDGEKAVLHPIQTVADDENPAAIYCAGLHSRVD